MALHLDAAVAELGRLGVSARAMWRADEVMPGTPRVLPCVSIGDATYIPNERAIETPEAALDWALVVATLARGVRA